MLLTPTCLSFGLPVSPVCLSVMTQVSVCQSQSKLSQNHLAHMSSNQRVYKEKINLKVTGGLSFQGFTLFLYQKKSGKCLYFPRGCCFTCSPLIFATQSLTILLHVEFCISLLADICEHFVLLNFI